MSVLTEKDGPVTIIKTAGTRSNIHGAVFAMMPKGYTPSAVLLGLLLLLAGVGFYLLDRPPASVYFIFKYVPFLSAYDQGGGLFQHRVFGSLPMFFHVCAFSLFTAGCFRPGVLPAAVSCLFWLSVNMVFEVFQKYDQAAIALIPSWFETYPWLESFRSYFEHGSFDPNDLWFAVLGAISGFLILLRLLARQKKILQCP
ncbi:MAG: hypothetical protein SWH68_16965 [Thermodesulfobacteriota bacterium]|nr:hypothetical protein [Thermodesulfobacteriota bacterium]